MSYEYAGTGVDFQSIKPYYVATKLTQNKLQHNYSYTTMIPSAEEYTRQALGTIGRFVTTHGYAKGLIDLDLSSFWNLASSRLNLDKHPKDTSVKPKDSTSCYAKLAI